MKSKQTLFVYLYFILVPQFFLQAQVPRLISYQGVLTDASGNIRPDGDYDFTFTLFDGSTGGNMLWSETKSLSIEHGLFNTHLGDQTGFPVSLLFDKQYWLSIKVGNDQLSDRIPLTSVGYSLNALRADSAQVAKVAQTVPNNADLLIRTIKVKNQDSGQAGYFEISNPSSQDYALEVKSNAVGGAAALQVVARGEGPAAHFSNNQGNDFDAVEIRTNGNGEALFVYTSGSGNAIEAQTAGAGYAGYFRGNVYSTGSYEGSDIRWKKNISTMENAMGKVMKLRGIQFEWNIDEYPDRGFREGKQIGLIAQEVEEILPELVRKDQDGYKAIDYEKITAVLIEALKEQQREIKELKAAISEMNSHVELTSKNSNAGLQE